MGIEKWSTSAGSNNMAPPDGWPGGMLPSQVEPTGRQMMASIASWYQAAEWINYNFPIVYSSATVFTISTNVTALYHVGRRVQATDGSTSVFGTITTSAFTSLTTVTVVWDSGVLQTGVTIVYVGITSAINTSAPSLGSGSFANPSASVGLTAVNGTATTAMRSDASPLLSQAISPTWTGTHRFIGSTATNTAISGLQVGVAGSGGSVSFIDSSASTDHKGWDITNGAAAGVLAFRSLNDAVSGSDNWLLAGKGTGDAVSTIVIGSTSSKPTITLNGPVTIPAPASGIAATVTAVPNQTAALINGSSTTGQSYGLTVNGGTNSSDAGVRVFNASATFEQFAVRGDGVVLGNDGTSLLELGYKDVPLNVQSSNYQLTAADRGKAVQAGASITITAPSGVFSGGAAITIFVGNGATVTIAQGAGLSMQWAGNGASTGSRTLTGAGMATILYATASVALISGAGLT